MRFLAIFHMFNGRIVLASNFKLSMNSESWYDSYPIYLSSLQSLRKNPLSAIEVVTLPSTHEAVCLFLFPYKQHR